MAVTLVIGLMDFWIIALVDCLSNEPTEGNDKLIWALVIIFLHFLGALLYYIVRRPNRPAVVRR
ncbi:MAG: PLD nuclease N-terminal domain-containing protein [Opitutales bacterium]